VAMWSRNRMLPLGILLAVTPMALYSAAVVNPSGLEICAGGCLWGSGVVLVIVAVSAAVVALSRPFSPLWLAVVAACLIATSGIRPAVELLRRRRLVRVALGA